jgi:pSer/pThr/pTyr-binding forkhead associated (FHA) protein
VRYEGGEFQIADLDSSNGTFVNDEKVQKTT